jgi:hypothetical protein
MRYIIKVLSEMLDLAPQDVLACMRRASRTYCVHNYLTMTLAWRMAGYHAVFVIVGRAQSVSLSFSYGVAICIGNHFRLDSPCFITFDFPRIWVVRATVLKMGSGVGGVAGLSFDNHDKRRPASVGHLENPLRR